VKKVVFINSHPIQYFAPLYKYLNEQSLPTSCWYCSDENVKGHLDRQFGTTVAWDVPLLGGYLYRFFKNYSLKPSLYNGFFGLFNPGMIRALFKEPKSIVVVHGWAYMTHILVLIFARLAGHTVCLRGESPLNQELLKSKKTIFAKRLLLQWFLFRWVHYFLYIGKQNKDFYKFYGVPEYQLLFTPYAVDNDRFQKAAGVLAPQKKQLRQELGLPVDGKIILFTAKYIQKKRPLDLLEAYRTLNVSNKCLVMVGDGELRSVMERMIEQNKLLNVFLTGFINQKEIEKYYAIADVFVLCSEEGETWGLSVNEALNFSLPVVVSNLSGCSYDLVSEGEDGYVFQSGNISELQNKIKSAISIEKERMPLDILSVYSYRTIQQSLRLLIN